MSVTLTIAGTSYVYPSIVNGVPDEEWGDNGTNAIVAIAGNGLWKDGSVALTANWDAGSFKITAETIESDVATGTAPFTVASTTLVTNLNADKLDGADLDTDGTLSANSDTKVPSQKAVKTYADAIGLPEGTDVKSTGEVGATKFLREDGDGTCSWQPVAASQSRGLQVFINGDAYVDTNIVWLRVPYAITADKVRVGAVNPPTGSALNVDVNYSASNPDSATPLSASILTSPPLSLSATSHTAETTSLSTTSLAAGGWLAFDIDAVGSTTPGTNIVIEVLE
jgi:hypothetical protein